MLSCQHVTLAYDGTCAVEDVSFTLKQGEYLCVVGENGSGKTTLMKGVLGLIRPLSGQMKLLGLTQTQIGYLPQQTLVQKDFPASVREVVLSGCLNRHKLFSFYTPDDKKRAKENMRRLGIENLKNRSYRDLSGGQQQRVLLARALCATEKLIVLDEPAAGLDPVAAGELYTILSDLNRGGVTIIMISHDVHAALRCASHILHMQQKALFFGPVANYRQTKFCARLLGGAGE